MSDFLGSPPARPQPQPDQAGTLAMIATFFLVAFVVAMLYVGMGGGNSPIGAVGSHYVHHNVLTYRRFRVLIPPHSTKRQSSLVPPNLAFRAWTACR